MADISTYLEDILSAVYGKDVRQSIYDAIKQCYYDGHAGAVDLAARESLAQLIAQVAANVTASTDADADYAAELVDARVSADGVAYGSAGDAVRGQAKNLSIDIVGMNSNYILFKQNGYANWDESTGEINAIYGLDDADGHPEVQYRCLSAPHILPVGSVLKSNDSAITFTVTFFKSRIFDSGVTVSAVTGWVSELEMPGTLDSLSSGAIFASDYTHIVITAKSDDALAYTDLQDAISIYRNINTVYNHNALTCGYIFVSQQGSNCVVEVTSSARAIVDGTAINLGNYGTVTAAKPSTNYAVTLDADGFAAKEWKNVDADDIIVASCINGIMYSDCKFVICNAVNIASRGALYQREGYPYCINFARLGYIIEPSNYGTTSYVKNMGGFLKVADGFNFSASAAHITRLESANKEDVIVDSNALEFAENTASLSGKKILMIGDSITNRGWIQDNITAMDSTVEFIGTNQTGQGIGTDAYLCEGYPGKTAAYLCGEESPFYNPETESFDYDYYCSNNGITADIVIIGFGLNESSASEYLKYMQAMIDSIKAYDADIAVYVIQPFRRRIGAHDNTYSTIPTRICNEQRKCMLYSYALEDCTLIPAWVCLNDNFDYSYKSTSYGIGNSEDTITYCSDNIHPSEKVGFVHLSNMILGYLGA